MSLDPRESDEEREWVVLKFGGTSVSSIERWQTIAETLRNRLARGNRVLVVCSALSQVSNRLEALLLAAAEGREMDSGLAELHKVHTALAADMGLDAEELLGDVFEQLAQILEGIRLTGETTPRLRARVLSSGEILSTRLGAAWLRAQGVEAVWQDARELLEALPEPLASLERQYYFASCATGYEDELDERLRALPERLVLTQGFVASLPGSGDTVLLGRGGSDTAAAYFAAKLGAEHLEIWTDVPGLFTANPHAVPEARLLLHLSYDEAQELASKGAKVLHPRSIRPVQEHGIPIHIHCTPRPELEGTTISPSAPETAGIKAVSERTGIVLVSMEVDSDWQPIGLIADLTACFKDHGLSIDLVTSSQTNLTIALDPRANSLEDGTLGPLVGDLRKLCSPRIIRPAAALSLVGSGIRTILHEWAGVLEEFEDENVYLVAQAANDLSFNLVIDQGAADDLVQRVHRRLFEEDAPASIFGPSWESLVEREDVIAGS